MCFSVIFGFCPIKLFSKKRKQWKEIAEMLQLEMYRTLTLHLQSISINCYFQHEHRTSYLNTVNIQFLWQLKHQTQIIFFEHKWFINWFIPLDAFVVSKSSMAGIFPLRLFKFCNIQRFAWKNYVSANYSLLEFYVNEIKINKQAQKNFHKKWPSGKICGKTTKKSDLKMFRIEQPSNCGRHEILSRDSAVFFFNSHFFHCSIFLKRQWKNGKASSANNSSFAVFFFFRFFHIVHYNVIVVIFMKICWI